MNIYQEKVQDLLDRRNNKKRKEEKRVKDMEETVHMLDELGRLIDKKNAR